jgi:hypothetical protein
VCERETERQREILTTIRKKLRRNPSTQKQNKTKGAYKTKRKLLIRNPACSSSIST